MKLIKRVLIWLNIRALKFKEKTYWLSCYIKTIFSKENNLDHPREIEYLKKYGLKQICRGLVYPYTFYNEYNQESIKVELDQDIGLGYVTFSNGRRLYYPSSDMKWIAYKANGLFMEQDTNSPHRYFCKSFPCPQNDEIFIDVGAAEGGEALEVVDKAKSIILIEKSKGWVNCLKQTFKKELKESKVKLIEAYVSNNSENGNIRIDDIVRKGEKYVLKMDIEGAEMQALYGAKRLLETENVRCVICIYHKKDDIKNITHFFEDLGYEYEFSEGWCLNFGISFSKFGDKKDYFRKGVIRAKRRGIS